MSKIVLDVDSLANLLARYGIGDIRSGGGKFEFRVKGGDIGVKIKEFHFAGDVDISGLAINLRNVGLTEEGVELEFSIE